jgi:hypothetical protein
MRKPPAGVRRMTSVVSQATTEMTVRHRLRREGSPPDVTLACVYRSANADNVAKIVDGFRDVKLWALDEPVAVLTDLTIGAGPGSRTELLNRCLSGSNASYAVFMDDDISFVVGDLARLLCIARRHRLDLCQPSQSHLGYVSVPLTIQRRLSGLRITNYVEVGPLVVVGPRLRPLIIPFPPDSGLGWGLDIGWTKLRSTHDAKLAVVDAVVVKHLNPMGAAYSIQPEEQRLESALADIGASSVLTYTQTEATVRPWAI